MPKKGGVFFDVGCATKNSEVRCELVILLYSPTDYTPTAAAV
jgi:hypothetical protein